MDDINIFWFRRDLRIEDNCALSDLVRLGSYGAIYIHDTSIIASNDFSRMHLDFINDSLKELSKDFRSQDGHLNIFTGAAVDIFNELIGEYNILNVYSNQDTGNGVTRARDEKLKDLFIKNRVEWSTYQNNGVIDGLNNRDGWSSSWNKEMLKPIITKPSISESKKLNVKFSGYNQINNIVEHVDYEKKYVGGATKGLAQLDEFLNLNGRFYSKHISSPLTSENSCSRLSPYITYGNLSIRQITQATRTRQEKLRQKRSRDGWLGSLSAFSSRLRWHCHFIQKLEMQPNLEFTNMVSAYDGMRDDYSGKYFEAWKRGCTGYPMVDACMRFLKTNGWINFRMRAMLVSFASYNLWLDWRPTSKFLSKYFIDYEPGIHYNQFQMQSGVTGINAIRIYNPVKQQGDHDPDGLFVKKWCPELSVVPKEYLQFPHLMSESFQKKIGCIIGKSYPEPIVDLKISSLKAKKIIYSIRSSSAAKKQSQLAYELHGSRRKPRHNKSDKRV